MELERKNKIGRSMKIILLIMLSVLTCSCNKPAANQSKEMITTSSFVIYDFTKNIVKDKMEVKLLPKPGANTHLYDPSPQDVIDINNSKFFIFTGEDMEPWAHGLSMTINPEKTKTIQAAAGIKLLDTVHTDGHDHEEDEEEHRHNKDPHVWTSPFHAQIMIDNILDGLCETDKKNCKEFTKNAEAYKKELDKLDKEIRDVVAKSKYKTLYFAGHFAHAYFVKEYGLEYKSTINSCINESEPSLKAVKEMSDIIKKKKLKVILYHELSKPTVAYTLEEMTNVKSRQFHSLHNLSKRDFDKNETYISITEQNIQYLKEILEYDYKK